MLDAGFLIAKENGFGRVIAQVPALDDEFAFMSDSATYFAGHGFTFMDDDEVDGIRVFLLEAPADGDQRERGAADFEEFIRQKMEDAYSEFPSEFLEIETEFFSGVSF